MKIRINLRPRKEIREYMRRTYREAADTKMRFWWDLERREERDIDVMSNREEYYILILAHPAKCSEFTQTSKNMRGVEFLDTIAQSVRVQEMTLRAANMIRRQCPVTNTIHAKIAGVMSRRLKLYVVVGFLRSQFQTQVEPICVQDSTDGRILRSVISIIDFGSLFFSSFRNAGFRNAVFAIRGYMFTRNGRRLAFGRFPML